MITTWYIFISLVFSEFEILDHKLGISRSFRNARQEDAHEYMVNLLESMHKCCLPAGVSSESPSAYEKSLVHKIFGGRLRSQVLFSCLLVEDILAFGMAINSAGLGTGNSRGKFQDIREIYLDLGLLFLPSVIV